jgi:hypothetical protein
MPIIRAVLVGAQGTPTSVTIDGIVYRILPVDRGGRPYVALDVDSDDPATVNQTFTTAQTDTIIVPAPASGLSIYLTSIVFSTAVAGNFKLHELTSGNLPRFGPHFFPANGGISYPTGRPPIQWTDGQPVRITTNIAGSHTIDLAYFVAPQT